MAIKSTIVIHNPTTKKHEPLASGDVLAGSIIQVSTDAGNSLQLGTDGGLKVAAVAQLPDDQVLTGDNSGSVSVTLTPTVVGDQTNYTIKADTKIDPAAGNIATVSAAGVYVPEADFVAGANPDTTDDGSTPTTFFGGNAFALGAPQGFLTISVGGVDKLVPYYAVP